MSNAQKTLHTEAVVLRLTDYGEADRVVTLLTAARGKLTAIAKGARQSRKRFGAALSIFGHGEAALREGRHSELLILEGFYSARGFSHLPMDLARLSHASYALELCQKLCPPNEPEPEVLRLLLSLLSSLDELPLALRPRAEALRVFELQLLSAVGLGLQLGSCAACGEDVPRAPIVVFDRVRGGVLCAACHRGGALGAGEAPEALPDEVRQALQHLLTQEVGPAVQALELPSQQQQACRNLLLSVIRHHLGQDLRAVEFIAKLNLQS